jgi:hypothetical protein
MAVLQKPISSRGTVREHCARVVPVLKGQMPLFCEPGYRASRSKAAEKLCNTGAMGQFSITGSFNCRFIVILLSCRFRSSKMLETHHQTTRRHLNIHFCENLRCSSPSHCDTFRGRLVLKKESGFRFAGCLLVVMAFGTVWNVRVNTA